MNNIIDVALAAGYLNRINEEQTGLQLRSVSSAQKYSLIEAWATEYAEDKYSGDPVQFVSEKISAIVKPKCFIDMDGTLCEWRSAATLEDLYEEGYFSTLLPNENVLNAVKILLQNPHIEVYVLSAVLEDSVFAIDEKKYWVGKYLPEMQEDHILLCKTTEAKGKFVEDAVYGGTGELGQKDLLLDDYTVNLRAWEKSGGKGLKLRNAVNGSRGTWKGDSVGHTQDPEEIAQKILSALEV